MSGTEASLRDARIVHPILLYDGVCGLCNRSVQFILRHDHHGVFRFASLQSGFAQSVLARHGVHSADLNTVYVVVDYNPASFNAGKKNVGETLLARSDAVLFVMRRLGGIWRGVAWIFALVPRALREWGYRTVARYRYRIFGRYDTCPLPSETTRARFLDL